MVKKDLLFYVSPLGENKDQLMVAIVRDLGSSKVEIFITNRPAWGGCFWK